MSFLESIRGAVSAKASQAPAQQGPAQQGGQSQVQVFDNSGKLKTENHAAAPPPSPSPAPAPTPQSIEELFAAPAPAPAPAQNQSATPAPAPAPNAPVELAPGFTQQNLLDNIRNVNIAPMLNQEVVTAALGGDAQAFMQLLNTSTQLGAALAIKQSLDLSKSTLDARLKDYGTEVDSRVKDAQYSEIYSDPRFSSPLLRPMVENLVTKIRQKDPNASVSQIKETLPSLIQYTVNNLNLAEDQISQTRNAGTTKITEKAPASVNLDEFWNT